MKITNSIINLNSTHSKKTLTETKENLRIIKPENIEIKQKLNALKNENILNTNKTNKSNINCCLSEEDKGKIFLIEKFIENLTGKKIKIKIPESLDIENETTKININTTQSFNGWGVAYDFNIRNINEESLHFNAKGHIETADDGTFDFNINILMKKIEENSFDLRIRLGSANKIDPLIIFDDLNISFKNEKIDFDLNNDGQLEKISIPKSGGFLFLDKNNNGKVDEGRELFGTILNDGFKELKEYDQDNNNYIDENDSIFTDLKIWDGDKIVSIYEKKIGAIYLGNISSQFDFSKNLEFSKSSIVLNEDKSVSLISHINFKI